MRAQTATGPASVSYARMEPCATQNAALCLRRMASTGSQNHESWLLRQHGACGDLYAPEFDRDPELGQRGERRIEVGVVADEAGTELQQEGAHARAERAEACGSVHERRFKDMSCREPRARTVDDARQPEGLVSQPCAGLRSAYLRIGLERAVVC